MARAVHRARATAGLWNYALFFWGEDAVADNLSPYIDAAPLEEQKYFLATQQVDEARHAVFFKRFMQEVCGIGDGSMAGGLEAIRPQLTPGFRRIFDRLDKMANELRTDRSRPKLAAAITLYHVVIEASLAQPGQHMIVDYLEQRDLLPAFRQGMHNIAADEQRHIGFGVKLIADLNREEPRVKRAVADLLREVIPHTSQVLQPPGWDERYLTCFDSSFDKIGVDLSGLGGYRRWPHWPDPRGGERQAAPARQRAAVGPPAARARHLDPRRRGSRLRRPGRAPRAGPRRADPRG